MILYYRLSESVRAGREGRSRLAAVRVAWLRPGLSTGRGTMLLVRRPPAGWLPRGAAYKAEALDIPPYEPTRGEAALPRVHVATPH